MPSKARPTIPTAPAVQVAFLAAACGALKAGEALPDRLLLLKWGENDTPKGKFIVNERTAACLATNQRAMRREAVKGDFEHASVNEDPAKHPMHFGSEGTPQAIPGTGLLVAGVTWTDKGREYVPEHYGDLSAVPIFDPATREVIAVHSYAHCRHGAADGASVADSLEKLNASIAPLSASLLAASPNPTPTPNPTPHPQMNPEAIFLALLSAYSITLPANPSEAQVATAVEALKAKLNTPPANTGDLTALRTEMAKLTTDLAAVKAVAEKAEKLKPFEVLRDTAMGEGRMVTLTADDLLNLGTDRAKAYIETLSKDVVPMQQRTPGRIALSANPLTQPAVAQEELKAYADLGLEHPSLKKKTETKSDDKKAS